MFKVSGAPPWATRFGKFSRGLSVLLMSLGLWACGGDQVAAPSPEQLAALRASSAAFAGLEAPALLQDPAAVALGNELYAAHCASCHGRDARGGGRGVPDLVAGVFNYGDSVAAIRTTIAQGRHSIMPKHAGQMGEVDVGALVSYVRSFSSGEKMDLFENVAINLWQKHCIACHGPEGRGNLELGVPDLTDNYWQYGDSMMNIRMTISGGAEGVCPAHQGILSEPEIELLTASVLDLRAG